MKKKFVISGVSKGIGRALTEYLISNGHAVAGCARSETEINNLNRQFGPNNVFGTIDVAEWEQVQNWSQSVLHRFGVPDLLVNNAALINRPLKLWEINAAEFDALIDVNVKGTANIIRAFLPAMLTQKSGIIINISSGWGRFTEPLVAPYCASKFAIEGLTKALAQELPPGFAAIPLSPGVIDTEMLRLTMSGNTSMYQSPVEWAQIAGPFILKLGPKDNGKSLRIE